MKKLLAILLPILFFASGCLQQEMKYITPQYRFTQQRCLDEISALTGSGSIGIGTSSHLVNNKRLKCDLDIKLINGNIPGSNKAQLDSLSGVIARLAYRHITNIDAYDWINVMYLEDSGRVADPVSKGVNVFSKNQLKRAIDNEKYKDYSRPVER